MVADELHGVGPCGTHMQAARTHYLITHHAAGRREEDAASKFWCSPRAPSVSYSGTEMIPWRRSAASMTTHSGQLME